MIKLLTERWNLPVSIYTMYLQGSMPCMQESEERSSVKIFYWLQSSLCDDRERGVCVCARARAHVHVCVCVCVNKPVDHVICIYT